MKKISGRYVALGIEAIIFVVWNVLSWTLTNLEEANVYFYCGYGFMFLAFLLTAAVTFYFKISKNVIFSVLTPLYIANAVYFFISLIMNSIFMGIAKGANAVAVVVPNVIVLILYVVAIAISYLGVSHISENNKVIDQKVAQLKITAIEIGQIASIATDVNVKNALLELKDAVEYSDPIGVSGTKDAENDFSFKVSEIRSLIENEYPSEDIQRKIYSAKLKLRERNELLRALK